MKELTVHVGCPSCSREAEVTIKDMLSGTSRSCPYCREKFELSSADERKAKRALRQHQRSMRALASSVPYKLSTL